MQILVDSSVWIDFFRGKHEINEDWLHSDLFNQLNAGLVLAHPFVLGELACGQFKNRKPTLDLLREMRQSTVASDAEVLSFIENHALYGRGIGYVDAHLLASALLSGAMLWTLDKRLQRVAQDFGISYNEKIH